MRLLGVDAPDHRDQQTIPWRGRRRHLRECERERNNLDRAGTGCAKPRVIMPTMRDGGDAVLREPFQQRTTEPRQLQIIQIALARRPWVLAIGIAEKRADARFSPGRCISEIADKGVMKDPDRLNSAEATGRFAMKIEVVSDLRDGDIETQTNILIRHVGQMITPPAPDAAARPARPRLPCAG